MAAGNNRTSAHEDRPRFQAVQAGNAAATDRTTHGDGSDRDRRHGSVSRAPAETMQTSSTSLPRTCSSTSPVSFATQRCSTPCREDRAGAGPRPLVRQSDPRLDRRVQHGRRNLLPCHAVPRGNLGRATQRQTAGLCVRYRPGCVATARDGRYPETIEADVSPARLARYFMKEDQGYRVAPDCVRLWSSRCRTCWLIHRSRGSTWCHAAIC